VFEVDKDFSDDNPAAVDVTISCNTGLPLHQTTSIAEGDGVSFVVTDFSPGALDCEIFETVPGCYQPSYAASGDSNGASDEAACYFTAVEVGDNNTCAIENQLLSVDVTINKEWIDEHPEYNLPQFVEVELTCSGLGFIGARYIAPGSPGIFSILPHYDGTICKVKEEQQAGVLSDIDNCKGEALQILPGQGAECTIVNTRLFAGIPALDHYGLALLAMLMLGIGLVACRTPRRASVVRRPPHRPMRRRTPTPPCAYGRRPTGAVTCRRFGTRPVGPRRRPARTRARASCSPAPPRVRGIPGSSVERCTCSTATTPARR
jgi:hypothetical protein